MKPNRLPLPLSHLYQRMRVLYPSWVQKSLLEKSLQNTNVFWNIGSVHILAPLKWIEDSDGLATDLKAADHFKNLSHVKEVFWDVGAMYGGVGLGLASDPGFEEIHFFEDRLAFLKQSVWQQPERLFFHPYLLDSKDEERFFLRATEVIEKRLANPPTMVHWNITEGFIDFIQDSKILLESLKHALVLVDDRKTFSKRIKNTPLSSWKLDSLELPGKTYAVLHR